MRVAVYTCITGGYDYLKEPICQDNDYDFFCFSDQPVSENSRWQWKKLEEEDNKILQQRRIKLMPKELWDDYDVLVWVDGSIALTSCVKAFIEKYHTGQFTLMNHEGWDCTYMEAVAIVNFGKDKGENVMKQLEHYNSLGFPRHYGQVQTGLMIRNTTDMVKHFSEKWLEEVETYSHRDQMSFMFTAWRFGYQKLFQKISSNVLHNEFYLAAHTR